MTFDDLLDRLYGFDAEIFAHDSLFVFINYRTKERKVFHNCSGNSIQEWIDKTNPILMGYNCNNYDKHILRCWLAGMNPEELKQVNDHIIGGGNGWDIDVGYVEVPIMWDLFNEINPRKSLKECEGNLRLPITESAVPFDLPTQWTKEQYDDVVYYCTKDVEAVLILFDRMKDGYLAKYTICEMGDIEPAYGLSLTNANLTAKFLKAKRKAHNDKNDYQYPSNFELDKILPEAKEYFDSFIRGEIDIDDKNLPITLDGMRGNVGSGGIHLALDNYIYVREDFKESDYYE